SGRTVVITGVVQDDRSTAVTVNFTGVVSGSAQANALGKFSYTADATALENATGTAVDDQAQTSDPRTVSVTSDRPVIVDFSGTHGAGDVWTFTGGVWDESRGGMVVRCGGLPSLQGMTVQTGTDGNFRLTVQLAPAEAGTATAVATDCWGLESDPASCVV